MAMTGMATARKSSSAAKVFELLGTVASAGTADASRAALRPHRTGSWTVGLADATAHVGTATLICQDVTADSTGSPLTRATHR
ncbi:hypothetical protein [Herbidospora cretacea]|uniref:hypothetical protein n=1 Tax=Herbidospora cretacea TaxID=28444 RepID=UPI0004C36850|nr:hypothetical protein [Herbidospora cretacea]